MSAQTPPLLLTKRLTAFLAANLSPTLHAALLTTPSGKLLAHASTPSVPLAPAPAPGSGTTATTNSNTSTTATAASPTTTTTTQSASPVALLRTQATVAASLYALHAAAAPALAPALPESATPTSLSSSSAEPDAAARPAKPLAITVQLSHGVLLIRRLKCGLLFVCIGPLPEDATGAAAAATTGPHADGGGSGLTPASPDDRDSVLSAGAATTVSVASSVAGSVGGAAVVAMRRQAEELARWLDDKLGSLRVPEEGVGVE
ncbi:hypothetical protein D7B24_003453 [Verticillium nonalfalfae]|uniref:Uncharacterized protein n=1 Tax=Verticillium nonalfalfae TaxID=1051616 RepID=A0A3M9YLW3_9PEZI|nr:uncharacterized protein D7B24_003453 [Verticillium nonalfalfae]RNJ61041.1 hypothetical protein D7B24_003453 [Verticillium nonalfalfae]